MPVPYRRDVFAPGEYYHIFNRGADKGTIFFTAGHYEHCLRLFKRYRGPYGATIVAYCLMPNHYHLLLRQDGEAPPSRFINVVFNAYVQAVNRERKRKGTLLEGRFRHVLVDREAYVEHLCRYIHLNPVIAGLVARPEDWPYSNYREWVGERACALKDEEFIRQRFPRAEGYRAFVEDEIGEARMRAQLKRYLLDP